MIARQLFCAASLVLAVIASPLLAIAAEDSAADAVAKKLDVVYAQRGDRALHADLFWPAQRSPDAKSPAIVLVHGGGWVQGDRAKFHPLATKLAERGYVVAAIEYRLAGEAKFPAAAQDVVESVVWLRAHAADYQIDPEQIAAVGGSAGGHLVALAAAGGAHEAFAPSSIAAADRAKLTRLSAAVVLAGPLDIARGHVAERSRQAEPASNAVQWIGKTILDAPEAYELASPRAHFSKTTPPILVQVGELDHPENYLTPMAELRQAGGTAALQVFADGKHGCWNNPRWMLPMVDAIDAFLATSMKLDTKSHARASLGKSPVISHFSDRVEVVFASADEITAGKPIELPALGVPTGKVYLTGLSNLTGDAASWKLSPEVGSWLLTPPVSGLPKTGEVRVVIETLDRTLLGDVAFVAAPQLEGVIDLPAHRATVTGKKLRYEPQPVKNTVGYWTEVTDQCQWKMFLPAGTYDVEIHQGCGKGNGGSEVDVVVGETVLPMVVEDTGHFQNFKPRVIGRVTIEKPITTSLLLRPTKKAAAAVMDVRLIRLLPVASAAAEATGAEAADSK